MREEKKKRKEERRREEGRKEQERNKEKGEERKKLLKNGVPVGSVRRAYNSTSGSWVWIPHGVLRLLKTKQKIP